MAGQFDYPHFYSNLASLCDNVSIRLDSAEARIQELVEQLANEPDSNKIALLARELNVLLQAKRAAGYRQQRDPKGDVGGLSSFHRGYGPHRWWWKHWVTAGMLFLVSALQLLRNNRAAFPVFAVAWVLGAIGN